MWLNFIFKLYFIWTNKIYYTALVIGNFIFCNISIVMSASCFQSGGCVLFCCTKNLQAFFFLHFYIYFFYYCYYLLILKKRVKLFMCITAPPINGFFFLNFFFNNSKTYFQQSVIQLYFPFVRIKRILVPSELDSFFLVHHIFYKST